MKNWVNLNLLYVGKSKKHYIFRAKHWDTKLERLFKSIVFDEKYQNIGYINDIFGPINSPFVSIKVSSRQEFNPNGKLYSKLK